MSTKAIPAATILLLRDEPAFEVLMIERHADITFAGGAMVFPGGRIDPGDRLEAWADHCDGYVDLTEDERAPRIASIREAFEETGILFARRNGAGPDMVDGDYAARHQDWRKIVEDDDARFLELIKREDLVLALDALHFFARWVPPTTSHLRRYDTRFYAAKTPLGQIAYEDGNEATEVVWTTPAAVLEARKTGARKMIFPTVRNVELLNVSTSADDVFKFTAQRKIETVQPKIIEREGETFVTIPEDLGYPVTEESVETAFRT